MCSFMSIYLSGKNLKRRTENTVQEFPLHIIQIILTHFLGNEEISNAQTTNPNQIANPIVEPKPERRRIGVNADQPQAIAVPDIPRNPTGPLDRHRNPIPGLFPDELARFVADRGFQRAGYGSGSELGGGFRSSEPGSLNRPWILKMARA